MRKLRCEPYIARYLKSTREIGAKASAGARSTRVVRESTMRERNLVPAQLRVAPFELPPFRKREAEGSDCEYGARDSNFAVRLRRFQHRACRVGDIVPEPARDSLVVFSC